MIKDFGYPDEMVEPVNTFREGRLRRLKSRPVCAVQTVGEWWYWYELKSHSLKIDGKDTVKEGATR